MSSERERLFAAFAKDFLGLGREDPVATLEGPPAKRRRVYLDATATSLMPRVVWEAWRWYFEDACANSHTHAHAAGRATTLAIERSRELVGRLVGYDPATDVVIFTGNGATGATNLLADAIFPPVVAQLLRMGADADPAVREATARLVVALNAQHRALVERLPRDLVVVSKMEHHSNMLPWIRAASQSHVRFVDLLPDGTLDLAHLGRILAAEGARVRVVAVTGVSNVTGIVNPVHEIARLAHRVGAEIVVDAAQAAPHVPIAMHPSDPEEALDYVIISGHKLYAPGSRGVLVGKRAPFAGDRVVGMVGGGSVDFVSTDEVRFKDEISAREEAGTPNIPGTIALGVVAKLLLEIGMDTIRAHEAELVADALPRLLAIPDVVVYGSTDTRAVPRAGVIAFNLRSMPHGLVAAALSDFFAIAVRNDCFCAQPYVKEQLRGGPEVESACSDDVCDALRRPGMVRASFGAFTTHDDVAALEAALRFIVANQRELRDRYAQDAAGEWSLKSELRDPRFTVDAAATRHFTTH